MKCRHWSLFWYIEIQFESYNLFASDKFQFPFYLLISNCIQFSERVLAKEYLSYVQSVPK